MKAIIIILYVIAGIFLIFALLALVETFAAKALVENALFGYRVAFGPIIDTISGSLVGGLQSIFVTLFVALAVGAGMTFGLARLLALAAHQKTHIQELEVRLSQVEAPQDQ